MKMLPEMFGLTEMCNEIAQYRVAIDEIRRKRTDLECEIKRLKSEFNETLEINRLLAEWAHLIFKWLPFQDLLACEHVCQSWQQYVRQLNITKLVISKKLRPHPLFRWTTRIRPRKWFFSAEDEPYFPSSPMELPNFSSVKLKNSFLLGLKQLKICDKSLRLFENEGNLDRPLLIEAQFLNEMVKLEVLEIPRVQFDLDNTLRLPELKYLAIKYAQSHVVVDCPRLTHFRTESSYYTEFARPESVTHLYASGDSSSYGKFKNLQYMCLLDTKFHGEGEYAKYRAIEFLSSHRQLKELSLRPTVGGYNYKNERGSFLQLLKQKRIFNRDDLKLIFYGIHLTDAAQLENASEDTCTMLSKLYIRNCTKLCDEELCWIRSLNYTAMMEAARQKPTKIPLDIHQRLFNVRQIAVTDELNDEEHFFRFINGFRKLVRFRFTGKSPGETFFERLAINCASNLYVELEFNKDAEIDDLAEFDFIFKFKNLSSLVANRDFSDAFVKMVFERFPSFELRFKIKQNSVKIVHKSRSSKYEYPYGRNEGKLFDSLDDLLNYLNEKLREEIKELEKESSDSDSSESDQEAEEEDESDENQKTDDEESGEEENGRQESIGEDQREEKQEAEGESEDW